MYNHSHFSPTISNQVWVSDILYLHYRTTNITRVLTTLPIRLIRSNVFHNYCMRSNFEVHMSYTLVHFNISEFVNGSLRIWFGSNSSLTESVCKVMDDTVYNIFLSLIFIQCQILVFSNTCISHTKYYYTWCFDINRG